MKFEELGLSPELLKSVDELGYTEATEIQKKAIPILTTAKQDFVGVAQTGTGKTAAFVLPLLENLDPKNKNIQALILSPTRELANQIKEEIDKLGRYKNIRSLAVFGGASYTKQINGIRKDKPQIIVGTPGRLMDLMNQKILKFDQAEYVILDEADEMLNMGFFDDVQEIISAFSNDKKMWMFSATMPRPILQLINKEFKDPEVVKVAKKSISNENIDQRYFLVKERDFSEALCRILSTEEQETYGIVFCRTRMDTKNLADDLLAKGIKAETLHGELNQSQRDIAMRKFKRKQVKLLVCTDVAARGIDVDALTHVFNYGLPQDIESYVHRIGRTGRAGMKGIAISLVDPKSLGLLRRTERFVKKDLKHCKLPSVGQLKSILVEKSLKKMVPVMEQIVPAEQVSQDGERAVPRAAAKKNIFETDKDAYLKFSTNFEDLDRDDLLKLIYQINFAHDFLQLERYGDLNEKPRALGRDRERGSRGRDRGRGARDGRGRDGRDRDRRSGATAGSGARHRVAETKASNTRLFVNIGKDDGIEFMDFISEMSRVTGLRRQQIQNVSVRGRFSFIDIPSNKLESILGVKDAKVKNRKVRFEQSS